MKLASNLGAVIARLKQLQAGYPGAVRAALTAERWRDELIVVAEKTLAAHVWALGVQGGATAPSRKQLAALIPMIVQTIIGTNRPGGSSFAMWLPPNLVTDIDLAKAAKYAGDQLTPMGRAKKFAMPNEFSADNLDRTRAALREWVELEKNWDERDQHADGSWKTAEEVAVYLEKLLGLRTAYQARNEEMNAAATSLQGAIGAWLNGEDATPGGTEIKTGPTAAVTANPRAGISNDQARQWLGAVLAAWVSYVRVRLPDRLEKEFTRLHATVAAPQQNIL